MMTRFKGFEAAATDNHGGDPVSVLSLADNPVVPEPSGKFHVSDNGNSRSIVEVTMD